MTTITIKNSHPARNKIAGLPNYFDSEGAGFYAVNDVLNEYGMQLDWGGLGDYRGDEGNHVFDIRANDGGQLVCSNCDKAVEVTGFNSCVSISWYKMQSGRYEIVAYIT